MSRGVVWALVVVMLLGSRSAPAQPPPELEPGSEPAVAAAQQHFEAALASYRVGEYRDAIHSLERALELDPDSKDLEYNLAIVYEKLGELERAIEHFRRYAELETDPAERERTERTVLRLEGAVKALAEEQKEAEARPAGTPAPDPTPASAAKRPTRRGLDAWVVATGALSGVALVTGAVLGVAALRAEDKSQRSTGDETSYDDLERYHDQSRRLALGADIALGVGVSIGVASVTLFFTPAPRSRRAGEVRLPIVGVQGRF